MKTLSQMSVQNIDTLLALGFTKITSSDCDEYLFRGRHQKFIAKVVTCNGPHYVSLFHAGEVCTKPLSPMFGKHYRMIVKDCTSDGSVEKALKDYDLPEGSLYRTAFGTQIK